MTALDTEFDWRVWPAGYGERCSSGLWLPQPHLEELSAAVVETVFGPPDQRRLIVTMPPRHGKSETTDVWTPVWYLDLFPHLRVMLLTYGQSFASEWGAKVRDAIRDNPELLRVRIAEDSDAKNRWSTTAKGGLYAVGVGGPLTGRGGDLIIVDDPHKNWDEANSRVYRERLWTWWKSTVRTRLEKGPDGRGGAIIVVMTRWHEDDFVGRLLAESGMPDADKWRVLNLPAFAEKDDALGRPEGQPLWPGRYDARALAALRADLGPYLFDAMFQQHPSSPLGQILRREWWRRYEQLPVAEIDQWLGSWDVTFGSQSDDGSYVVGQVWARKGANKYAVDQVRGRWDYPETKRQMRQFAAKWPQVREWVVEKKANGAAIISELRGELPGLVAYSPKDSKEARAHACAGTMNAGQVWLPMHAPWADDLVDEAAQFPHGANDDMVDTFTQAMLHMGVGSPILTTATWRDNRLTGSR